MIVGILVSLLVSFVIGGAWGIRLERDAQERFSAPRPLPVAYVVRDERLDITPALRRAR